MLGQKQRSVFLASPGQRRQLVGLMENPIEELGLTGIEANALIGNSRLVRELRSRFAAAVQEAQAALNPWERVWKVIEVGTFPHFESYQGCDKVSALMEGLREGGCIDWYWNGDHRTRIECIPLAGRRTEVALALVSMADLNLPPGTAVEDFLLKAERFGLNVPGGEIMFQLGRQYTDQPEGKTIRIAFPRPTPPRERYEFDEPYMYFALNRREKGRSIMPHYERESIWGVDNNTTDWVFVHKY